jgi:hypothetical protein
MIETQAFLARSYILRERWVFLRPLSDNLQRRFTALCLGRRFSIGRSQLYTTVGEGYCVRMCWDTTSPVSGWCSAISMGEKPRADHCRLAVWVSGAEEALPCGSVGWDLAYRTPYSSTLCRAHRVGRRRLSWGRSAERAIRQFLQHLARDLDAERGNRVRIMSLGADAAILAGESPAAAPGLIVQHGRRGRRGKNGSAR